MQKSSINLYKKRGESFFLTTRKWLGSWIIYNFTMVCLLLLMMMSSTKKKKTLTHTEVKLTEEVLLKYWCVHKSGGGLQLLTIFFVCVSFWSPNWLTMFRKHSEGLNTKPHPPRLKWRGNGHEKSEKTSKQLNKFEKKVSRVLGFVFTFHYRL